MRLMRVIDEKRLTCNWKGQLEIPTWNIEKLESSNWNRKEWSYKVWAEVWKLNRNSFERCKVHIKVPNFSTSEYFPTSLLSNLRELSKYLFQLHVSREIVMQCFPEHLQHLSSSSKSHLSSKQDWLHSS